MKNLYGSFGIKLFAVILLCCMALAFVGSAVCAAYVLEYGGYTGSYSGMEKTIVQKVGNRALIQIGNSYQDGLTSLQSLESIEGKDDFWFEILDAEGKVLLSDYEGGKTLWESEMQFEPHYSFHLDTAEGEWENEWEDGFVGLDGDGTVATPTPRPTPAATPAQEAEADEATSEPRWIVVSFQDQKHYEFASEEEVNRWARENSVTVKGYLPDPLPESFSEARELRMLGFLYAWRYAFLWIAGVSLLLGVLLFIFLLRAAGHRKGTDEIVPGFVERIPFDLFTILVFAGVAVCMMLLDGGWDWPEFLVILCIVTLGAGLLFLLWCMSLAVRVKTRTLLSSCLVWRVCSWLWRGLGALVRHLPILWKWALGLAAAAFVDLIFRMNAVWSEIRASFFWFLFWLLAGGVTLYAVLAFRRLRLGAKKIADGSLLATVEEKNLVGDFKDHARDLNRIRDGLNNAVEERMKSERFRTELITNVSHDIKTPLTSIVNYVDLLQKEEPENEKQREYLEVLARQSAKLKKLIEDLIDASKASTGNLSVDLQPCDLAILLDQTAGEYGERLENAGMELVTQKPGRPVTVLADGRHLWRVIDNLMNNIVKYAQPGTRVYLTLSEENDGAELVFRNISREPLTLDAGELSERFVRGDASRSTEGNGLGLAIAMSLMRLQKGELDLKADGDLFKATLRFDKQK